MGVKIWYTELKPEMLTEPLEKYLPQLRSSLHQQVMRKKRLKNKKMRLFSYLLLQKAFETAGIESWLDLIEYSSFDRPFIDTGIDFNISHSGNLIVCALSQTCKLGIDVEYLRPKMLIRYKSFFTATEWQEINATCDKQRQFYKLWTKKEAVVKADGRGFTISFKSIPIKQNKVVLEGTNWYLKEVNIAQNYIIHLASNLPTDVLSINSVDFLPIE